MDFFYAGFLLFVKIKAKHIPFRKMKILQIIREQLFAPFIVCIAPLDFEFNYILLAFIIDYQIHTFIITSS